MDLIRGRSNSPDQRRGGRTPLRLIIARDSEIIAEAVNLVAQTHDPTAHAEISPSERPPPSSGPSTSPAASSTSSPTPARCAWPPCITAARTGSSSSHRGGLLGLLRHDRKYFTLAGFYGEIGKPWRERSLPMVHEPDPGAIEVYRRWREKNG